MTQCIIPGCERNPDPSTVINVDPTRPMKEIQMDEIKNNVDNIPESFKQFLATGSSVIETCRELLAENERLRKINDDVQRVFKDHGIMSADNLRLYLEDYASVQKVMEKYGIDDDADLADALDLVADGKKSDTPADYQTLKDFKGEMDAIHEEFDIPKDVEELRKALSEWKTCKDACDSNRVEPDELDEKLEELDAIKGVMDNKDISDADDLENYLDEVDDFQKYKKGFEELADFVEKLKECIGSHGDDIPSTDIYDYD
jgi:DNA repair exonuclease SbcCD ATPase subunit